MLKYKGTYLHLISMVIKKPMYKQYGKKNTKVWVKQAQSIYKEMFQETDDVGADTPMAVNIYMGYVFMAIWKAADGEIGLEDFKKVTQEMMQNPLVQKLKSGTDMNKPEDAAKMKANFHRMADWLTEHPQYAEHSWDYHFDEEKHKDGVYYYFTKCPMEEFARKHGFTEILPVLCDLDYCTAATHHAKLIRDETLALGGKKCDYWFVPDKTVNPQ